MYPIYKLHIAIKVSVLPYTTVLELQQEIMEHTNMFITGYSPQGQPYAQLPEGLFPCPYLIQPRKQTGILGQIMEKGSQWVRDMFSGRRYCDISFDERLDLFQHYRPFVTPNLINVIPGKAIWRLPYYPASGRSEYLTEGMAFLTFDLFMNFQFLAVGAEQNRGDIFLTNRIKPHEQHSLESNRYPDSLSLFGVPGPGVCGRPLDPQMMSTSLVNPYNDFGSSRVPVPSHGPRTFLQLEGPPPRSHQQYPRTQQGIRGPRRKFASDTESSSESGSGSDTATEAPRKQQPKGKGKNGKAKSKPKTRHHSPSGSDEDEEDQPRRAPRGHGTKAKPSRHHRSFSDDEDSYGDEQYFSGEDDERPARKAAAGRGARGGRRRGRSPSDEEEELPAIDEEEKKRLEALKAQNGYGKGRDEKKGLH